ncbi:MAG: SPASM domain-containing protein [Candidatus Omnitrophica bacterium]|nr:SPASM domain-containing protein [Candidatus Omnitrophota bacterium]
MCFYARKMDANSAKDELSVDEYAAIARKLGPVNVLGISGGEPFLRADLHNIVSVIYEHCTPLVLDLPTNGYFTDSVLRQVEIIARNCRRMTVDIQLSIDGPQAVHDDIRQLKGSFIRMNSTYTELLKLRKKFSNLRLKACVVYSSYNQDYMPELLNYIKKDMSGLDRLVFSVAHGTAATQEALNIDWNKYFEFCDSIRNTSITSGATDFHSLFTQALRVLKNDFLKEALRTKEMYRYCRAGRGVVAVGETGEVFPCEPLWHSVGNLRENQYDLQAVLRSQRMQDFQKDIVKKRCNCHWGIPMTNAVLFSPRFYPRIVWEMGRSFMHHPSKCGKVSCGV